MDSLYRVSGTVKLDPAPEELQDKPMTFELNVAASSGELAVQLVRQMHTSGRLPVELPESLADSHVAELLIDEVKNLGQLHIAAPFVIPSLMARMSSMTGVEIAPAFRAQMEEYAVRMHRALESPERPAAAGPVINSTPTALSPDAAGWKRGQGVYFGGATHREDGFLTRDVESDTGAV